MGEREEGRAVGGKGKRQGEGEGQEEGARDREEGVKGKGERRKGKAGEGGQEKADTFMLSFSYPAYIYSLSKISMVFRH